MVAMNSHGIGIDIGIMAVFTTIALLLLLLTLVLVLVLVLLSIRKTLTMLNEIKPDIKINLWPLKSGLNSFNSSSTSSNSK
jgi:uncharacterized membrane protein